MGEVTRFVVQFLADEEKKKLEKVEELKREQEAESKRGRSVVFQKGGMKRSVTSSSISSEA
eukprot:NODE_5613_length_373_cov_517.768519_g4516_i0.p1 GENE.NODE_5613_length_373_cov_517.768519_g4516_i0~~NODE_5613_length_373_cov_517.768519_g4516_i0.p1  ORF type:complete len:70 (-),score=37.57 NODE_5613_length_373_cov_517.768519_g4516_i0:164-346(-)